MSREGDDEDWFRKLSRFGRSGERMRRQYLAQQRGMAFVDLDRVRPDPAAQASIPATLARELRALPVKRNGKTLWVALEEPDLAVLARVKEETGLRVMPVLCVPEALDEALASLAD